MPKYPAKGGKVADRLLKKMFIKGKKGKANLQALMDYINEPIPLGPGYEGSNQLIGGLVGNPTDPGLIEEAIAAQRSILPQYADAVQRGLNNQFFDIAPYQEYAERGLRRETIPAIAQTFAGLNTALSSDTTGQITNAVRDTFLDLAAQDAGMEFQAQNALVNQGGLTEYMAAEGMPAQTALGYSQNLQGLDTQSRQLAQSAKPGAGSLFPSQLEGSVGTASQISAFSPKITSA
jgi:hypothetical protein